MSLSNDDLSYLAELLDRRERPPTPKKRSVFWQTMNLIAWAVCILLPVALLLRFAPDLLVGYGIVSAEKMCKLVVVYCQETTTTTTPAQPPAQPGPQRQQPPPPPPSGGQQPAPIVVGGPLPSCSGVSDSTTACQQPPAEVPAPVAAPLPYCEDVAAGAGITACQWRDAAAAQQTQQETERQSLQLWVDMADQAVEQNVRAPETTPTAEVPTECQAPPNDRARAACELIKRGIIHPKG